MSLLRLSYLLVLIIAMCHLGFTGGSVINNPPIMEETFRICRRLTEYAGLTSGSGRSSGVGNGNPLQYSCLGNPMGRGAWWAQSTVSQKTWI